MVQPVQANGLVWIDPARFRASAARHRLDLREALAWRWIADSASARVDREPIEQEPRASIHIDATVDLPRSAVTLDGHLSITAGAIALETVPIWIEAPGGPPNPWLSMTWQGGRCGHRSGSMSRREPRFGFPKEGLMLELPVKIASRTEKTIHFHAEYPWTSGSKVPILAVSRNYLGAG